MSRRNIDTAIFIWLIGLSFWTGTVYMRIQHNEQTLSQMRETRLRIWDRLNSIDNGLSVIKGKLEARQRKIK